MGFAAIQRSWGRGEVATLMRAHDWSQSPLGSPESWSQSLQTITTLILNSKFPMFVAWGPGLGFLYNDAYREVLADKHPAALGRPFQEIWSEIWSDIEPIVRLAMAEEASYYENLPLTMWRKGYEELTWFSFSYSPVYDDASKVAGLYCACTETTRQVLAENERVSENERLRQLFQQAPGIMAVLRTPQHVFELANDAYFELIGGRELIGKPVSEALPEIGGQGLFELLDQVYADGEPYVGHAVPVKLRRQNDSDLEVRFIDFIYQPIRDNSGRVTGIFIEGSDVTEAVTANRALQESEQRLRALANTIPHLAWMANPDGTIHWYNDRWYEYTGSNLAEMLRLGWQRLHHPSRLAEVVKVWELSIATGKPFEMTFPLRSAAGDYRTFFTQAAPLLDSSGNIVQWFGTNTDIDEIEKIHEELRAANRHKDEFLAMLAHELRNPLAPISTAAELLKLGGLDRERIAKTSGIIARQVAHMSDLVDDLLDVSRVTRGLVSLQLEPLQLLDVIADAVEQVHTQIELKRQWLAVDAPTAALLVVGDRTRLTQVFSNILNNASKYTPEQGQITVEFKSDAQWVEVSVRDNGIGMPDTLLPFVFDLFTQAERSPDRSQGGLGLGLALVKSLVELHGGKAAAFSAGPGAGSTLTVSLPLQVKTAVQPADQLPLEPVTASLLTLDILVVDDNIDAAETLSLLLQLHGHSVRVGHDAGAALRLVREHCFQAIILDIGLPDMDGYELAERIRVEPNASASTLIALTGYGQDQVRERSQAVGFAYHLVKPVSSDELLNILSTVG